MILAHVNDFRQEGCSMPAPQAPAHQGKPRGRRPALRTAPARRS
jgi:hypothetical protein